MINNFQLHSYYKNSDQFLKCFDINELHHRGTGGADVYNKANFEYPYEVDPTGDYLNFLKTGLANMKFIRNLNFVKSWWIDYPKHSYSGVHSHTPGLQLTSVLFLNTLLIDDKNPHDGFLFTVVPNNGQIAYDEFRPVKGNIHVFDSTVWHGTYPTLQPRKAFVCDFTYETSS